MPRQGMTLATFDKVRFAASILKRKPKETASAIRRALQEKFGASVDANLLAKLKHAARDGNLGDLEFTIHMDGGAISRRLSARGRIPSAGTSATPATKKKKSVRTSPGRRRADKTRQKFESVVGKHPLHFISYSRNGETTAENFMTKAQAKARIIELMEERISEKDIALYSRETYDVETDIKVTLGLKS